MTELDEMRKAAILCWVRDQRHIRAVKAEAAEAVRALTAAQSLRAGQELNRIVLRFLGTL